MNSIRAEFIIGPDDRELGDYTLEILPRVGEYVCLPDGETEDGFYRYRVLSVTHLIFYEDIGHHVMVQVGNVVPSIEEIEAIVKEYDKRNA